MEGRHTIAHVETDKKSVLVEQETLENGDKVTYITSVKFKDKRHKDNMVIVEPNLKNEPELKGGIDPANPHKNLF